MIAKKVPLQGVEDIKTVLKREIISFMTTNDLSQYAVAEMCKLPSPYINQILGTKAVSIGKLLEIASRIGMKLTLVIEKK